MLSTVQGALRHIRVLHWLHCNPERSVLRWLYCNPERSLMLLSLCTNRETHLKDCKFRELAQAGQ